MTRIKHILALIYIIILPQGITAQKEDNGNAVLIQRELSKQLAVSYDYYMQGDVEQSFKIASQVIKEAQKIQDNFLLQRGYSYLGYNYVMRKDTVEAVKVFNKSFYYAQLTKSKDALAGSYCDLGNIYGFKKETLLKAYGLYDKALAIYKSLNEKEGIQYVYNNYATTAEQHQDTKKVGQIAKAMRDPYIYNETATTEYTVLADIVSAGYYVQTGNYKEAKKYYEKAYSSDVSNNLDGVLEESYESYANTLYQLGEYQEAYNKQKSYSILYKKLEKERSSEANKALSTKFQISEYKNEIANMNFAKKLQQEKNSKTATTNLFLLGILGLALFLIMLLFIFYRKRTALIEALKVRNEKYLKEKEKSERLSAIKTNFFSTVSHELRTPLYGVIGLTNILLAKNKADENKEDLESLKFSADHLLNLINDVLLINKLEYKGEQETTPINLNMLLKKITTSFEHMRSENKNTIAFEIKDDVPLNLSGSVSSLSQVLMNLISNANKFTKNGKIKVSVEKVEQINANISLKFSVSDTGSGIDPDKLRLIFQEFEQLDRTDNSEYQGSGLGLSIVKKLLHLCGSEIHAESVKGKGSNFYFTLDMIVLNTAESQKSDHVKDPEAALPKSLENIKILIAEDNKINQLVTRKILEQQGVKCDVAENGQVAVELVLAENYDLILMDINMPIMNGIEASKIIRKTTTVPIIALTASDLHETMDNIQGTGINDVIIKPYDIASLNQKIIALLETEVSV